MRTLQFAVLSVAVAAAQTSTFPTPEAAVTALVSAVQSGQTQKMSAVLGPELLSNLKPSDPNLAAHERDLFLLAAKKAIKIERDEGNQNRAIAYFGEMEWPFPAPLVSDGKSWHFDGKAGIAEVEDRRIGRNELTAIAGCRAYVAAQLEYSSTDWDGDGILEFAQHLASSPGKQDGLYWNTDAGQPLSALGPLLAAAEEGSSNGQAFGGYYFRILTRQGPAARGGARDYRVGDDMVVGFALIAWPAQYGVSGFSTFIVNQLGDVFEKDLGGETASLVKQVTEFNPDSSWAPVGEK